MFDVTEKRDNGGVHVEEIVDKECLTKEVDVPDKEAKGARSARNCDLSVKKDEKKQSSEQEIHTVNVSNEFDTLMSSILHIPLTS